MDNVGLSARPLTGPWILPYEERIVARRHRVVHLLGSVPPMAAFTLLRGDARATAIRFVRACPWVKGLALLGMTSVLMSTRWGPGISYDSAQYLFAARSLASGRGLAGFGTDGIVRPFTWWGPLLPVVLASGTPLQVEPEAMARIVNAACLGAIVVLAATCARTLTSSVGAAIFVALVLITTVPFMAVFAFAWSEPPFMLATIAGLMLLVRACTVGGKVTWVAATAVLSLAPLFRHVGLLLPPVGALVLYLAPDDALTTAGRRLRRCTNFLVFSSAPFALWALFCLLKGLRPTGRSLDAHGVPIANLELLLDTLATWLVPGGVVALAPGLFRTAVCVALGALLASIASDLLRAARGTGPPDPSALLRVAFGLLLFLYLPALLLAAARLDPYIAFDFRLLSPMFVPALLLVVARVWPQGRPRATLASFTLIVLTALLMSNTLRVTSWLGRAYVAGNGYERPAYRRSRLLAALRTLPQQPLWISNDPILLYTHAGLVSARVPGDAPFEARIQEAGGAHAIYFCGRTTLPPPIELAPSIAVERVFASECPAYSAEPSVFAWPPDARLAEGVLYRFGGAVTAGNQEATSREQPAGALGSADPAPRRTR